MFIIPRNSKMATTVSGVVQVQAGTPPAADPGVGQNLGADAKKAADIAQKSAAAGAQQTVMIGSQSLGITDFLKSIRKNVITLLGSATQISMASASGASQPNDYIYNIYSNLNVILVTNQLTPISQVKTTTLAVDTPMIQAIDANIDTLLMSYPSSGSKVSSKLQGDAGALDYLVNIDLNIKKIMDLAKLKYMSPLSLKSGFPWKRFKELEQRVGDLEDGKNNKNNSSENNNSENNSNENNSENNTSGGYRRTYKKRKSKRKARKSTRKTRKSTRKGRR